ncbi:MAG: hypothetical protein WDM80_15520 [Limisphaerales bacterium]
MPEEIFDAANERLKVLFICSRNRRRSLTAETIFKGEPAWDVRSAGTEESARIKVTAGQLGWADVIVVMEKRHKERLQQKYPGRTGCKTVHLPFHFRRLRIHGCKSDRAFAREKCGNIFRQKKEQLSSEGTRARWLDPAFCGARLCRRPAAAFPNAEAC